jgi:hypothetical protein
MKPLATPEVLPPSTPLVHQDDIKEWDRSLRGAVDGHRSTLVEIAYYGAKLRSANGWSKLGFADEDDYRQDVGMGEKTWKDYLKLGERLSHLSLEEMSRLTFNAARLLTKVDSRIWQEYSWAEEAALLAPREFAMLVDQRNRQANPSAALETSTSLNIRIGISQLEPMEQRIQTIRKQRKLQSAAAVVDYALQAAERQSTVVQKISNLESTFSELAKVWQPDAPWSTQLSEPDSEREARLKAGALAGLNDAAVLSQRLTRKILRSLKELHEVLPEASDDKVEPANPISHAAAR